MSTGRKYEVDANGMQYGQPPQPTQQAGDPYHAGYNQPPAYGQQPPSYGQQPAPYGQQPAPYGQQPNPYGHPMSTSTNVIVTNNAPTAVVVPRESDWLVPAVLSCLFCFWPTGICAIIAAVNARSQYDVGDHAGGNSSASWARGLTLTSLGIGLVWIILVVVLYLTVLQSEKDLLDNLQDNLEFTTKNPWAF